MMRGPLLLLLIILLIQRTAVHSQGNAANEFYIGFMQNYVKPVFRSVPSLIINKGTMLITTAEPSGALILIESQQGNSTHMVGAGDIASTSISGFKAQLSTDRSKGIRIKAEQSKTILVYALNEELHSVEGFTALPCTRYPSLSVYTYFAVSVPRSSIVADTSADSAFLIVACSDNTVVDITCTQNIQHPTQSGGKILAGKSFQITLNERETLYIQSRHDLTGSIVESTAPVSFYSGHECGNVPRNASECDHLVEQLPPTATWGRQFLLAPTATRRAYDIIKVIASENDTLVAVSCTNLNNVSDVFNISLVSAGKFSDFILSFNQYCSVSSDNPILVVQFATGKSLDNTEKGDPFMLMVPAVSQYLENTTFSTVSGLGLFFDNYMNVFSPAGRNVFDPSSVILDGGPLGAETWVAIPCSDGSVCGHAVQLAVSNGVHSIWNTDHGSPIGVTVYGMSFLESYAYSAALKLTLSDAPTITTPVQTSYIVLVDGSICLPCNVHPFHYAAIVEWQKNAIVLAENSRWLITNNGALCISNTTQNDGGNYSCHVEETSVSYQLSVIAGIIVEPPSCGPTVSSRMVLTGVGLDTKYVDSSTTALQICCNVEGPANTTTITWLQDNSTIQNGRKNYDIGNGYMRHTGPFRDGCVIYTCRASFLSHTIQESSEVCIGSIRPPTVVNISGDLAVVEHTSISYHCSANGFPIPQKMWTAQRDSEDALPPGAVDHGNGTLTIANITEKGGKLQYCCDTSNSRGQLSNCIMINVLVPPKIVRTIQTKQLIVPVSLPGHSNPVSTITGADIMIPETSNLVIFCEINRGNPKPSIMWLRNNVPVSDPRYTVQNDGSLRIEGVLRGRDDGVFTCVASTAGLGQDSVDTVVAVSVPPRINSTDIVGNPGNCLDLTQQAHVQQQVGSALCLRAGPSTSLSLYCNTLEGIPEPSLHWMKDGQNLSQALNGYQYYSFPNGLLLINNLTLPIEASQRGKKSLEGTYTCVATNVIGVDTGSSYVALFGNISVETAKTEFVRQSSDLYQQFHQSVSEHFPGIESGDEHLTLFSSGKVLPYREFDYGYRYDGSEETILPQTMENIFDLVNIIPDAGSIVFDLQEANRLHDTYSTLVDNLQVAPSTLSPDEQRKIRQYLLEVVPDPGSDESLPRLSLYLLYKNSYYMTKIEIENTIDAQRQRLPGWEFNKWYERNIHTLQMKASSVYMQWEMYAGKTDMEEKLSQLNLEDHAEEISDALALLLTNERKSRFKDEKKYSLVRLYPDTWYKTLNNRVHESIQQMQFQLAQLKTEIRVLEITSRYLDEKTHKREVLNSLFPSDDPIYKLYCALSEATYQLEELVKDSEDVRYNCIATGNPSECHFYWTLYEYISTDIIANYTEFYWYVHTVEAALNHREFSIPAIASTIASIETRVESVQSSINIALSESADRDDEENEDERDFLTNVNFIPTKTTAYDFELPQSITERLLWYINPESTRLLPKQTVQEYNATFNHLNTAITNISAKVMKVNIHRRWFKPGIFGNKYLSQKTPGILVSPGNIHPPSDFRTMVSNGSYQLPLYPSALILATDIQLFLEVPFVFHTLPTLVKLSYDPHVTGGIGLFSFGPLFHASTGRIKFRVSVRDSRIVVTIPGTQLVGFVCDVVPQHPREQVQQRKRRSLRSPENSKDIYGMESQFDDWLLSKKNREPSLGQVFRKPEASGEKASLRPSGQRNDDHTDGLLESLATLITPTLPLNNAHVHSELDVSFFSNLSLSSTSATTSASMGWKDDTKKSQGG